MSSERARERQASTDLEHLRLLSLGYYILSGLAALCAMFPIIHLVVGIGMVFGGFPQQQPQQGRPQAGPPPEIFGWFFIIIAGAAIILGWAFSICLLITARLLRRRRRYMFCFVVACIACLQQPFGIVLGIFTIIVLIRPSVKELFARKMLLPAESELDSYHHEE